MNEPLIVTTALCKSYQKGTVPVLEAVDLQIGRGEFVSLSGPSGCGKSTLLHLIAALDRPTSGSIVVDGKDLSRLHQVNRYRRSQIGIVFQMHNLLPHIEARRNVELAMFGTSRSARERTERAASLLEQLGLGPVAKRPPARLSGGERARV
ncbi:MAG: ATP-binding cassette domain-containing protein, partial [Actinomycetota bacterium]